jgi:predicted  nucleic acid-binding Zn-ribbon protein
MEQELKNADAAYDENDRLNGDIKNLNIEITRITKIIDEREKKIKDLEKDLRNNNNVSADNKKLNN